MLALKTLATSATGQYWLLFNFGCADICLVGSHSRVNKVLIKIQSHQNTLAAGHIVPNYFQYGNVEKLFFEFGKS